MELMQSFVYSISRVKLSLYEQRILIKIVEHAQSRLKGLVIRDKLEQWQHDFDNVKMAIPIKELLSDGSQHYNQVRAAALRLMERKIEYQDTQTRSWFATPIIYNVTHDAKSGVIKFYVARKVFDIMLDFTKGFRQYSLESALTINSPYASRLYALMSGQTRPLRMEVSELKKMFGVEDKYKQTADFIKKVIEPSKLLLDANGMTSYTYNRVREGNKVVAILFFPIQRTQETKAKLSAKVPVYALMPKAMQIHLVVDGGFSARELSAHKVLLEEFSHIPNAVEKLYQIIDRSHGKTKPKGYIVNALRSELNEYKDQQTTVQDDPDEPSIDEDYAKLGLE